MSFDLHNVNMILGMDLRDPDDAKRFVGHVNRGSSADLKEALRRVADELQRGAFRQVGSPTRPTTRDQELLRQAALEIAIQERRHTFFCPECHSMRPTKGRVKSKYRSFGKIKLENICASCATKVGGATR